MMRRLLMILACVSVSTLVAAAGQQSAAAGARAVLVLDNARVRVYKTSGASFAGVEHRPGVVVSVDDGPNRKMGDAVWPPDPGVSPARAGAPTGSFIVLEPKDGATRAPAMGSK